MKHIKTFESFLNEFYNPSTEEDIFYTIIRAVAAGELKPNGSNLADWLENPDKSDHPLGTEIELSDMELAINHLFGNFAGVSNFALAPTPEDESDAGKAKTAVEGLMKKGFKFVGSVNIDGYEAIVVGKRKGGIGDLQVATPLNADDFIEAYYNM